MSVSILNGPTVTEFVEDSEAFDKCINHYFMALDVNGDGVLSRSELLKGFNSLLTLGNESESEEEMSSLYNIVFEKFDADQNGTIDREEFRSEMKEIMLAVARGIGNSPVQVALEGDSLLMRAVEHELLKVRGIGTSVLGHDKVRNLPTNEIGEKKKKKKKMGVVIIDGSTVRDYVEDDAVFKKSVDERFDALDLNGDGVLSCSELRKAFESFRLIESHFGVDVSTPPEQLTQLYDSIFQKFDCDRSGTVDREEFRSEMKKIMLAIADGLGSAPIQMALEDDDENFLKKAADLEASKIAQAS
ncbi:hypothetical protein HHK36_017462 [Tetracentron sinense]|uniref:EF-hand domain-containing protein n=1 Tax=Tetracentron sinense TaxID=13715 RepID=A0A834Z2J0_TETSI|nr:hypothetical protein HHK36_017462 [Tetracentron sinense]